MRKQKEKMTTMTMRWDPEFLERLVNCANYKGITIHEFTRRAIEKFLQVEEQKHNESDRTE